MANFEKAWNEYWQTGLSTSCVSNGKDGYPPAIKAFWKETAFINLKKQHEVVDLCSGGGGIPKLMIDYCRDNKISMNIAVTDLATITKNIESDETIKLKYYSECNCEELPFKDNSCDFISSSYGIEYSHLEKTIKEINRTLKVGGVFCSIIHCDDSAIVKNSNGQLKQGHEIMYKLNFFDLFRNIYLARTKSTVIQKSKEKKLLKCLNEIKMRLLHDNELHVYRSTLKAAHDIFVYGQTNKPIKCIEYINKMEKSLKYNYQRMENLAEVVLSDNDISKLVEYIESLGLKMLYNEKIKSDENKILGLGLVCKK